ncbi:transposase family protein [Amycolatopsis sp. QT-25]|uniref:transposase family protein n=1 Tax=Amycolatopsis sp. QT-25 TaxID=3034022 RepID=UPI0023ED0D44|nr:transposase family protein [Amycolatopsis sp. QT-25]WET78543.1 transposase family protein [Amycolatopsis sp. QT-25]WET79772.1 transposase family protein [Amycolatopsis sp. QT-25]
MLSYPSAITLSSQTLAGLTRIIQQHRRAIRSRWRRLSCQRQALLVLAHLRNGDTYARLAAGFRIGVATVCRYLRETIDLLAQRAPSLTAALWQLAWSHNNYAILDGTVIRTDRIAANKPYYSGKHRHHGINLQALTDPYGRLLWISDGLPGATNDTTAARHHRICDLADQSGIRLLADSGYDNVAYGVITPYKNHRTAHQPKRPLGPAYTQANTTLAAVRGRGERGFATLKNWRVLTRVRTSTHRVTALAKAILTLEHSLS